MYQGTASAIVSLPSSPFESRVRLLVVFEEPLYSEAFSSLAMRDGRFDVVTAAEGPRSWKAPLPAEHQPPSVALLDGGCCESRLRPLIGAQRLVGGVLIVRPEHRANPTDVPAGGLLRLSSCTFHVRSTSASWQSVTDGLLRAGRGESVDAEPVDAVSNFEASADPADTRTLAFDLARYTRLTSREKEVLAGLGVGRSPREIGSELHIALSTVENHKARLMKKLDVHKSVELVRFAIRVGVAPL